MATTLSNPIGDDRDSSQSRTPWTRVLGIVALGSIIAASKTARPAARPRRRGEADGLGRAVEAAA